MSQLHLGDPATPESASESDDTLAALSLGAVASPDDSGSRPILRPSFRDVGHSRATLIEAPRNGGNGGHAEPITRPRIGGRYLLQLALTSIPLMLADLAVLTLGILLSRQIVRYFGIGAGMDVSDCFPPIATGFVLVAAELGLYPGIRLSPVEEFRRLSAAVAAMFAMWAVGLAMLPRGITNQPLFLILACLFCLVGLPIARGLARRILAGWSWWGFSTLVCGDDAVAVKLYHWLAANRRLGLRPVGVIADPNVLETGVDEPWYAGPWSNAREIAQERGVYWAVVVPPDQATTNMGTAITEYLSTIPHIHVLSELTGLPDHWTRHEQIDGLSGIHLQQNLLLPLPRMTKRVLDVVFTLAGGIVLLPLLFYIAVAVKMSSRGPVLYSSPRIGRDGRRFRMWKFRSMLINGDAVLEDYFESYPEYREEYETTHKLRWDPRITRIGRFIRKTSLDELPQLWNVFRGEMSLVGPRPILLEEEVKYGEYYPLYTMVSPGITGLWQVSGRSNTSYDDRLQLVAYYVRNWSLWLDIYLLLKTLRIVLFGRGAY
ncbi:MAG: undecaprenyl-phosphate galactose phosphotransferase WbaP [Pirellulales bacterium]